MTKKRSSKFRSSGSYKRKRRKTPHRVTGQTALVDTLLAQLAEHREPVSLGSILKELDLPRNERKPVKAAIESLERNGKVEQIKQKYRLTGDSGLVQAKIDLKSRGFGFALIEGTKAGQKDPFISQTNLNGASHGDTVLVRLLDTTRGRAEARVIKIVRRGFTRLCGIYTAGGKTGYVTPDNDRLPFTVIIRRSNNLGARDNTAVLVEILEYGLDGRSPEGKIVEILGDPLSASVQIRMAIEQFELPTIFSKNIAQEIRALEPLITCGKNRSDLRNIDHVTIDGETAKDFDDAIAVEKTGNGYRLYVSIADVSHYVKTGSAIDIEAYQRGTSVYFPDRVIPMLPERLSNDLCSLVPNEDRPAFTAILDFNGRGKRTGQTFCKSMIKSRQRFTYTTVRRIIYDKISEERKGYRPLLPMLENAAELADLLHKKRMERGSIGFNIPEADINIKGHRVDSIKRAERNKAHQLIEEFMLAANEAVAETLARNKRPVLYRIHEKPDPEKVEQFTAAASSMGLDLPRTEIAPAWFARVIEEAVNTPTEYVINNLMLRTMQQARYSPENAGHFGLAAEYYLHFTSPIRRYPDLVAHRVLQNFLIRDKDREEKPVLPEKKQLEEAGLHLSKRERVSVDVERNIQSRLSALYLLDHIGNEFDGIISGVTSFGLFVELLETFISGAVAVSDLTDDYYIYDSRAHKLIGEMSRRVLQMGNLVRVRLDHVDMITKKITFTLVE